MNVIKIFRSKCHGNLKSQTAAKEEKKIFFVWVFFHEHSRITRLQGKGESISLTPHHDLYPLHRHLDVSQAITDLTEQKSSNLLPRIEKKKKNVNKSGRCKVQNRTVLILHTKE